MTPPLIFSIEGNIGSGKSTLEQYLKTNLQLNKYKIKFLDEPVATWNTIKDKDGKTILEKYYNDQDKYAFSFQMMAYISRLSIIRQALREDYDIIFTERSIYTDRNVFAKMLYDSGKIEDINYSIYLKWFDEFLEDIKDIKIIYLKTDPKIANERVLKRNREGETIPLEYLTMCSDYHNSWIDNLDANSKLVINGNGDNQSCDYYELIMTEIKNFIIGLNV